jgi:hypothetical protein
MKGQSRHRPFERPAGRIGTASVREIGKNHYAMLDTLGDPRGSGRILVRDVRENVFQVAGRFARPPDDHGARLWRRMMLCTSSSVAY